MNTACLTEYFNRHITSETNKTVSCDDARHHPLLTVCTVGTRDNTNFLNAVRREVGPIIDLHSDNLTTMLQKVDTPWWLLMYDYEVMTEGLLLALPELLTAEYSAEYDGYAFFRRSTIPTRTYHYHTRLLRSSIPYDVVSLRPIGGRKYERILNGWVVYDPNRIESERRELP